MFRMYDTDKNGFLDQEEMDSIVDQMMTVAEYMGWETNELRPVSDRLSDMMTKCATDQKSIQHHAMTTEQWTATGFRSLQFVIASKK